MRIAGLEAHGHHGVHAAERELGQRFVVDLELELADLGRPRADDLADTVDYAELAGVVEGIVAGPPVALLETLAEAIAGAALRQPRVAAVTVTVHKPHAALPQVVRDVSVTLRRET